MSLPLVFRPAAQAEYDTAAAWYEAQQPGLGADFAAEIRRVLNVIADHPERYALVRGDVREALVSRFPYAIYYRVRARRVIVLAVFHTSRNPLIWQSRN